MARSGQQLSYKELDRYHEHVHIYAKHTVEGYKSCAIEQAVYFLKEVESASEQVLHYINELIPSIIRNWPK